jgi:hypothetical protein
MAVVDNLCEKDYLLKSKETIFSLVHPKKYFKNIEIVKNNIDTYKENIRKREEFLNGFKNKKETDIINFSDGTKKAVNEICEEGNLVIKEQKEFLKKAESSLKDYVAVSNKYSFNEVTTDNIMDYAKHRTKDEFNPNTISNIFHKYQLPVVQEGVKIISQ